MVKIPRRNEEGIGKRSVSLGKKQQSAKHQQTKAQRSKRPENRVGTINPLYVVTMNLLIDVVHVTSYWTVSRESTHKGPLLLS